MALFQVLQNACFLDEGHLCRIYTILVFDVIRKIFSRQLNKGYNRLFRIIGEVFSFLAYFQIERKAIIRNRYNYHNTFRSKTQKGKKDALKVTAPQSNHCKQKAKRTVFSPKIAKRLSKIKHCTKTNMQRHTMTDIVNHSRGTA